jgi:DNA polymerase-3 subunit beta
VKIITTQSDLNHALKLVGRAVSNGKSHPILADVLIDAMADGHLQISAFDLELGITTTIIASVETPGSIAVPYRVLSDIVGRLGTDTAILLTAEDTAVTLSSASGSYKLAGHDADDFPALPVVDAAAGLSVALAEPVRAALPAAATDESKQTLCGLHIAIADGAMRIEATDGHRLAIRTQPAPSGTIDIILPTRTLSAIQRLDSPLVTLAASNSQAIITADNVTITSRTLEGTYPAVAKLIPDTFKSSLTVGREELTAALERLAIVNAEVVKLTAKGKTLSITAESEASSGSENLACTGTFANAAFNVRYLLDGLKHFDSAKVQIDSNSPTTPVVITPTGVNGQIYLVMPIQTKV